MGNKPDKKKKNVNVKFTCPVKGGNYTGGVVSFVDGETKSVPAAEAKRLLSDFPKSFKKVGGSAESADDTDGEETPKPSRRRGRGAQPEVNK